LFYHSLSFFLPSAASHSLFYSAALSSMSRGATTTTCPPVVTASAAAGFLAEKLENARIALVEKGLYLGVPDVAAKVTWIRTGHADTLVTADAAAAFNEAHKSHASDPSAPKPSPPDPAIVSAVVFIPSEDYWLTSCGMWKEPTIAAASLADVKPTCTGQTPEHKVFADDFKILLKNVEAILEKRRTEGFKEMKGFLTKSALTGKTKLRFRHILFEV
jgi:hypothetical protein